MMRQNSAGGRAQRRITGTLPILRQSWKKRWHATRDKLKQQRRAYALGFLSLMLVVFSATGIVFVLMQDTIFAWLEEPSLLSVAIFFFLAVLEVVIAPIPGSLIGLAIASVFPIPMGFFIIYIGGLVGCLITYVIASYLGERYVRVLLGKKRYDRAHAVVERYQNWLPLLFSLPIFPVAVTCYVCALLGLSFQAYARAVIIGFFIYAIIILSIGTLIADQLLDWFLLAGSFFFVLVIGIIIVLTVRLLRMKP